MSEPNDGAADGHSDCAHPARQTSACFDREVLNRGGFVRPRFRQRLVVAALPFTSSVSSGKWLRHRPTLGRGHHKIVTSVATLVLYTMDGTTASYRQ